MSGEEEVWVQSHGRERELRVGGSHASLLRPGEPTTGSIWDALAAPALLLKPSLILKPSAPRVLVLGLGGGSCVRTLRTIRPQAAVTGVEISARVVEAAKRDFGLDDLDVTVVHGDAYEHLASVRSYYDLIIEDVFLAHEGALSKPWWIPEPVVTLARRRLRPGGVLAMDALHSSLATAAVLGAAFPSVLRLRLGDCDNHVLIASGSPLDARAFRSSIRKLLPALHANLRDVRAVGQR